MQKGKGPSIKDVRTKSRKIDPAPPCSQNVPTGSIPLLPPLAINFKNFKVFLHQKRWMSASEGTLLSANCLHWSNPLSPDCRSLLWKAPNVSFAFLSMTYQQIYLCLRCCSFLWVAFGVTTVLLFIIIFFIADTYF